MLKTLQSAKKRNEFLLVFPSRLQKCEKHVEISHIQKMLQHFSYSRFFEEAQLEWLINGSTTVNRPFPLEMSLSQKRNRPHFSTMTCTAHRFRELLVQFPFCASGKPARPLREFKAGSSTHSYLVTGVMPYSGSLLFHRIRHLLKFGLRLFAMV